MDASEMTSDTDFVFLPLGGTGEIGMNLNLYGFGPPSRRKWIMIDLGVTFGDLRTPGVDVIMADPEFIEDRREDLLGIVLTHAHEDHIGAVPYLWPRLRCPVYATPFTAHLVRNKLSEHGLLDEVPLHEVPMGGRLTLGPFDLEYVTLTHSIPEPNAIAIRTPLGLVLHTGDWKIDPDPLIGDDIDEARLSALGEENVRAIVCDSTNALTPGRSGSEAEVKAGLTQLIAECEGRIAVTTFASNIARIQSIAEAAAANGRQIVLAGRAMHRLVEAATATGYLAPLPGLISDEEAGYIPRENLLIICTGSQAEPRAALARMAVGNHPTLELVPGDTVIFSSRIIPGNELNIFELQNQLAGRGIRVITEKDHFVHVSGHPCREELEQMYRWVRPEIAVPVHGELRHLAEHAALARQMQVGESFVLANGDLLKLAPGPSEVLDKVPAGRLHLDGEILLDVGDPSLAERRRLSFSGAVFVVLAVDGQGRAVGDPEIRFVGVPEEDSYGASLDDRAYDAVDEALSRASARDRRDPEALAERVRRAVRAALRQDWGKKSHVEVVVTQV